MPDLGATRPAGATAAGRATEIRRAFVAAGPADAPALILLHGTRRTRAMWHHQLAGLADAFRVVAVDLPGHGILADVPFRLADASALVGSVIDEAGGGRAIVVGQSLGGYVGMDLAARRPDQVAGLVLANASAEPRTVARQAPATVGTYLVGAATERLRARTHDGRRDEPLDGRDPDSTGADGSDPPATSGWLFKGGTRAMVAALREAFIPRLAAYPGPTLLINGELDHLFRRSEQAFLAAAAHGRLEVIAGCGHLVNEDQPAAFNAAVRRFATEVFGTDGVPSHP
jgi:pimeloyl-ACP methyl ester carboxylesterase